MPRHHHASPRLRRRPSPQRLRLTAMIDVCFLLLIYFITTSSFPLGEGVITAKFPYGPPPDAPPEPPHRPITIAISAVGESDYRLSVNGGADSPRRMGQLRVLLDRWRHTFAADNPVVIRPQGRVRWQHVTNAFNAAVAAGYENVAFAQAEE
jgi:biopolymer transport protein ExbD